MKNSKCNGLEHVPACSKWPPRWLVASTLPAAEIAPVHEAPASKPSVASSWDLPPDLYEQWEERVCIMHFDGKLSWEDAESSALADVLGGTVPRDRMSTAAESNTGPKRAADQPEVPLVQPVLFGAERGPYG
jgi:hypothetical protein